jgi:glycosyltransferase involved in cell wall biosynthesis
MQDWKEWIKDKKVVLVTSYTYPDHAGGGLNAFNFGKFLVLKGYTTKILTFNRNLQYPAEEEFNGLKICRIAYFNKGLLLKYISLIFIFPRFLIEIIRNDIFIIYGGYIIGWEFIPIFCRLFQKRVIFRSTMYGEDDIESLLKEKFIIRTIRKISLNMISNYLAITPFFSTSYKKSLSHYDKIIETPQGVDINKFCPVENSTKLFIRKKLNIPENIFVIITVGSVLRKKGFEYIYSELFKLKSPFYYIVVGDLIMKKDHHFFSKQDEALEVARLGNELLINKIAFIGYIDNVNEYLQASDLFLMASTKEGLPNALLEAMSCGKPVVTNNINGVKDFLIKDNYNGFIFDDLKTVSTIIESIFSKKIEVDQIGENARKDIVENYSFEKVYLNLFK